MSGAYSPTRAGDTTAAVGLSGSYAIAAGLDVGTDASSLTIPTFESDFATSPSPQIPEIDIKNAQIVGEKLRLAIMENSQLDDSIMPGKHVTISVGVASFPQSGDNEVNVLGSADKALYKAKESGRNNVKLAI